MERKKEKELRQQLELLINIESALPGQFLKEIREVKRQLELIDVQKYREAVIRTRGEKLLAGEVPNKRAMSGEKRYAARKKK